MHTKKTGTRALVLGGGSVAGVAWELGMITGLREKGIDVRGAGLETGVARVPIVPAAAIFALAVGSAVVRPDARASYRGCLARERGSSGTRERRCGHRSHDWQALRSDPRDKGRSGLRQYEARV